MAQDDPFTLDLFGNTALSSSLGLGVTAFGGDATFDWFDYEEVCSPQEGGCELEVQARVSAR